MSKKKNKEPKKEITIDSIRRVRTATKNTALFIDCKKALSMTNGDEEKAVEYLMTHSGARSI